MNNEQGVGETLAEVITSAWSGEPPKAKASDRRKPADGLSTT
jgi:hypothetical protein